MIMRRDTWVTRLFQSIDNKDTDAFTAFLADDVLFRFGNADPVKGKAATGEAVSTFFDSIKGLRHVVEKFWDEGDAVICHGRVTYARHDYSLPGCRHITDTFQENRRENHG
jgi:ketosteroid isomerase-like protein